MNKYRLKDATPIEIGIESPESIAINVESKSIKKGFKVFKSKKSGNGVKKPKKNINVFKKLLLDIIV